MLIMVDTPPHPKAIGSPDAVVEAKVSDILEVILAFFNGSKVRIEQKLRTETPWAATALRYFSRLGRDRLLYGQRSPIMVNTVTNFRPNQPKRCCSHNYHLEARSCPVGRASILAAHGESNLQIGVKVPRRFAKKTKTVMMPYLPNRFGGRYLRFWPSRRSRLPAC